MATRKKKEEEAPDLLKNWTEYLADQVNYPRELLKLRAKINETSIEEVKAGFIDDHYLECEHGAQISAMTDEFLASIPSMEELVDRVDREAWEMQKENCALCRTLEKVLPDWDFRDIDVMMGDPSFFDWDCNYFSPTAIARAAELLGSHRAACSIDYPYTTAVILALDFCEFTGDESLNEEKALELLQAAIPEGFTEPAPIPIGSNGATIIEWYAGIEIKPGHYYANMPNEAYHRARGISKSGLSLIQRSPAHFRFAPKRESTRALEIGEALHRSLLEPEVFAEKYLLLESVTDRRSAEYKAAAKVRGGEYVLTASESSNVQTVSATVFSHAYANNLLKAQGYVELSGFWLDEHGNLCKHRFDKLNANGVAIDLKKARDARADAFARAVDSYGYHLQAAWYSYGHQQITGEPLTAFVFIAIEDEPPHGIGLYVLDDETTAIGHAECQRLAKIYHECVTSDEWPGYTPQPQILSLPAWALKKAQQNNGASDDE